MARISVDVDVIVDIYQSRVRSGRFGFNSEYVDIPHPGTNKTIQGWKWDKRTWPSDKELKAIDYAPTIWDASEAFIEDDEWQSGIGSRFGLQVTELLEERAAASGEDYTAAERYIPKVHHGTFFRRSEEGYLFSDDHRVENFYSNQLHSGVQWQDLHYRPKPGIPIKVRQYTWDKFDEKYVPVLDLRKKVTFTGTNDADTENDDGTVAFHNIDTSAVEFVVDYDYSNTPRVWLNDDYSDEFATDEAYGTYEFVDTADGHSNYYHLAYSPVDPSGAVEIVIGSGSVDDTWTHLSFEDDFSVGAAKEYKLDTTLGIIQFGTYDTSVGLGSGLIPAAGSEILARYTKGIAVEYEPEFTRDFVYPIAADANPVHNVFAAGFVVLDGDTGPLSIGLTIGSGANGSNFEVGLSAYNDELIATVYSSNSGLVGNIPVTFELLNPQVGSIDSVGVTTDIYGQAKTPYYPPETIDELGIFVTEVEYSAGTSILRVPDLPVPTNHSGVVLYGVYDNDIAVAIPEVDENDYYVDYINDEDLRSIPILGRETTSGQFIEFEKRYRMMHDLLEPALYDSSGQNSEESGSKIVIHEANDNAIHPHFGIQQHGTQCPIFPISSSNRGTEGNRNIELVYNTILPDVTGDLNSYLVVSESFDRARAYVTNPKTGKRIYSNTITLDITIPREADGILWVESESDIPPNMFNFTRSGDDWTNTEILLTSGELNEIYLAERQVAGERGYRTFGVEDDTVALLHFEGDLADSGPYNLVTQDLNGSLTFGSTDPIDGQYLEFDGLFNTDFLLVSGINEHMDLSQGTLETYYRAPYADYPLGSGVTGGTLFGAVVFNSTIYNNADRLLLMAYQYGATPVLLNLVMFSGTNGEDMAPYLAVYDTVRIDRTPLADGEWHRIRVAWYTDGDLLDYKLWVDSTLLLDIENRAIPSRPLMQETLWSGWAIAGGMGSQDEFRVSSEPHWHNESIYTYDLTPESYADWFRRTRMLDTITADFISYEFSGDVNSVIPVGFRLKDSENNVASLVDQRTFLDVNDTLPDSYYEIDGD